MCRHFVPKTQNALGPPNEYLHVLISRSPNFLVVKTDPTTSHHPSDENMHWWDNHLVTWLVPNNWKHNLFLSSFQCGEIITCLMLQRRMMTQILSKDSQPASTTDDNQSRQGLVVFVESPCMTVVVWVPTKFDMVEVMGRPCWYSTLCQGLILWHLLMRFLSWVLSIVGGKKHLTQPHTTWT